jgi:diaminopimelate decarboxylase
MTTVTPAIETDRRCDEAHAAELFGTPLFYYSKATLRAQIARLRRSFSSYPTRLLFATMANDRDEIQQTIAGEDVGACLNSIPHLERALSNGFPVESMQFTSCGLPVSDMAYLQSLGIPANLDSPEQVRAWCSLMPGAVVGARINASALTGQTPTDRIGMDLDDFARAREVAASLGGRVNGVHVYAGTNFQSARDILPTVRALIDLASRHDVDYVNIGGGIGVDYSHEGEPFDYEAFGREVCAMAALAAERRGQPFLLLFEPGRSLVASSGLFVTRVTDVKTLGATRYVVVDASVSVFPRPYHHPDNRHRVRVLAPDGEAANAPLVPATVVGRTTFSRDILANQLMPADLPIGSLLAFDDAGAYCESMISRFLGQREPKCYVSD